MSRGAALRLVLVVILGLGAGFAAAWPWHAQLWDRLSFGVRNPAESARAHPGREAPEVDAEGTTPASPAATPAPAPDAARGHAATPAPHRGRRLLEVPLDGRGEQIHLAPGVKARLQLQVTPEDR